MKTLRLLLCLCAIPGLAGCGGGSTGDTSSSSGAASGAAVKAVSHQRLTEFLPTLPGWRREDPQGETEAADNVSRVSASYNQEGGIGVVGVEIMDSAKNPNVLLVLNDDLKIKGAVSGPAGEKKVIRVSDYPAVQEWRADIGSGHVSVLVADRFVVGVTGSNVGELAVLHKALAAIDLKKLASLK